MFTSAKVAQMAAFFVNKERVPINVLKVMKLMYLADRESMRRHGYPISFDDMVSMPHGPVLSQTLNLLNGFIEGEAGDAWDRWITSRDNHCVGLNRSFERNDLDQFSDVDVQTLETVWAEFGNMNQWQLRDYTHEHCPEWCDPKDSATQSIPINDFDVLRAVGISEKEATNLAEDIRIERALDKVFAQHSTQGIR